MANPKEPTTSTKKKVNKTPKLTAKQIWREGDLSDKPV